MITAATLPLSLGPCALPSVPRIGMGFVESAAAAASGASWAVPAIGAAVAVGMKIFGWIQRRGQRKVAATQIVDEAERYLAENLQAYSSGSRTADEQTAAVENFNAVWSQVVRACSDPSLGDPGRRCVDERKRGGQWDWFARYLDPIANDTPTAASGQFYVAPGTNPVSLWTFALPLVLILIGLMIPGDKEAWAR